MPEFNYRSCPALDGCVSECASLAMSCDYTSISNRRSRSRGRKTATQEFVQLRTKLFASDQVNVEVVGINKWQCCGGVMKAVMQCHVNGDGINPEEDDAKRGPRAVDCDVDERSGYQCDGGHGGTGRG